MSEYIQVLTSIGSQEGAEKIAQELVEQCLAACVQIIGPIASIYRWQSKIEKAQEWLCLIKSRKELYQEIETAIRAAHPYEVPEILAVPVIAGSERYLTWLDGELKKGTTSSQESP